MDLLEQDNSTHDTYKHACATQFHNSHKDVCVNALLIRVVLFSNHCMFVIVCACGVLAIYM